MGKPAASSSPSITTHRNLNAKSSTAIASGSASVPESAPSEVTPLLASSTTSRRSQGDAERRWWRHGALGRVYLCTFVLYLSLTLTQTPIIYSFHTLACQEYHANHPSAGPLTGPLRSSEKDEGEGCDVPWVAAEQARQSAVAAIVLTISGLVNLVWTGYIQRTFGFRAAMSQQSIWASLRALLQIYGQSIGGKHGIWIMQVSLLTYAGGSFAGVQLVGSSYVAELSGGEERTGNLGRFSGVWMGASAIGWILGGWLYDRFWPLLPFQVVVVATSFSTLFNSFVLPHIPDEKRDYPTTATAAAAREGSKKESNSGFLRSLRIMLPRRIHDESGAKSRLDWSVTCLGMGAFLSTLATGWIPVGLQLFGTDLMGFGPFQGSLMQSTALMLKSVYLTLMFPRILKIGRRLLATRGSQKARSNPSATSLEPGTNQAVAALTEDDHRPKSSLFDLYFLRYSIFIDALITSLVSLASVPWHLYLAAAVLPLASGTAPACRGVVLDLVGGRNKAETLAGIQLMERLGYISTHAVFGVVFSKLVEAGRPNLVFLVNGATAMVTFLLLFLVRMPRTKLRDGD